MARKKKIKKYTSYKQFVFDFFKGVKPFEKRSARNIEPQELYDIIVNHFEEKGTKFSYNMQSQLFDENRNVIFDVLYDEQYQWHLSTGQQGGFTRRQTTLRRFVRSKLDNFYETKMSNKSVNMLYDVSFSNTWRNSISQFRGYLGPIIASSLQEAKMLGHTLYGFLDEDSAIVKGSRPIDVSLHNVEYSPLDFFEKVKGATGRIDMAISSLEKDKAKLESNIERLKMIKTTITTNANSFVNQIKENKMSETEGQ